MDYKTYRQTYFTNPPPEPRFNYAGLLGITLFFEAFEAAVDYYSQVLGPPAYVEGKNTKGWQIGNTWLTLLRGKNGNPQNVEVNFVMQTPQQAERLQTAFIEAGGTGEAPSDQLMYQPIRYCAVTDPYGTMILIFSPLKKQK